MGLIERLNRNGIAAHWELDPLTLVITGRRKIPSARKVRKYMPVQKRVIHNAEILEAGFLAQDERFAKKYPQLHALLTETTYSDGSKRETATVTLFAEDGAFKACLSDRDVSEVTFVTAGTVDGLWESLEKGLVKGDLDWRKKASAPSRKR